MEAVKDLVSKMPKRIEGLESCKRSRDPKAQLSFEDAVKNHYHRLVESNPKYPHKRMFDEHT